jgi:4-amino-4-deoxy-L-arabinose transferase-like glycosyltransferase
MLAKLKSRQPWLIILLFLSFLGWYLYRLGKFPIFADEAIYLNWAQRVAQGHESIFISVFDGKPPLFIWFSAVFSFFFSNLLFAGRLVSVLSLFIASFFIYRQLVKHSQSWAKLAVFFILASPFIFFHSRMALLDTLLSVFLALAILTWSNKQSKYRGLLTGVLAGLAFWSKTPALFFMPLPLLSSLILQRDKKGLIQAFISLFTMTVFILSLKLSIWFPYLFLRSQDFTFSLAEVFQGQINQIFNNFKDLISWLAFYLTWPVLILFLVGLYKGFKQKQPIIINLGLAILLLSLPIIVLGKVVAPRYYLPLGFFIPLVASYSLKNLTKELLFIIAAGFLAITFPINYFLQINPFIAHLPPIDERQYLEDWSSGIGIEHTSNFINRQAKDHSVKLLTEGYFGTLPDGLFVHQSVYPGADLEIVGVGSPGSDDFKHQLETSTAELNYYVGNHDRISDQARQSMKLVQQYDKKNAGPSLEVYLLAKP